MRIRDPRSYEEKTTMRGFVRTLDVAKRFGFIKVDETRKDFFFHSSDVEEWEVMVSMYKDEIKINVEFDATSGPKGPRAAEVSIVESE